MNRRRIYVLFIIGFLLLPSLQPEALGQRLRAGYFDSDSFWRSVEVIDEDAVVAGRVDTQVALVSNRVFDYRELKFAKEESATAGSLHYFEAFVLQGKWYIKPYQSLSTLLDQMDKNRSLVVYTEGYGKTFIAGLFRAFAMRSQYRVNVLYLDYPSINSGKRRLGNWRFVLKEAHKAGADFAPVLDSLCQYQSGKNNFSAVTLFYHSMGNLALKEILENDLFFGYNKYAWVDNLVLNAACVPAKGYTEWLSKANFARNILIHYNPEDRTLRGAQLVSGNRKIGVHPGEVLPATVNCVNFNRLVGKGHNYFLNLPFRAPVDQQVAVYMQKILDGAKVDFGDSTIFRRLEERKYELRSGKM